MSDEELQNHILHEMYKSARSYQRMQATIRYGGIALSGAATMSLATRAYDYLQQPPLSNESLIFLSILGFGFWGTLFAILSIMLALSQIAEIFSRKFIPFLFVSQALVVATYCAYLVAIIQSVLLVGGGWRAVATVAAAIVSSLVRIAMLNVERNS